ncbi:MAG TPA: hypothetical protein VID19_01795 [Candidatus Eremiobacteraceae bacterium]
MKAELWFAFAAWFAAVLLAMQLSMASSATPPANVVDNPPDPSPAATLAPIGDDQSSAPTVQGTATPKILGHEVVSAYCSTFVARFNVAATTMLADDKLLDDATAAETDYENDFFHLDGAMRSWDHRLAMIAALNQILHTIPKTQAAVNDLRAQAKASTDVERRSALTEGAAQLQTSIDHQRIVANELNDAVDATLDLHTAEDTVGHHNSGLMDERQKTIDPGDAPVPHPGDSLPSARAPHAYYASVVEFVLHMPRDRQLGADAESSAAAAATRVVRSCTQESETH